VPDAIASRVINDVMVPRLRADDRDGAVTQGVDALLAHIEGRPFEAGKDQAQPSEGSRGSRFGLLKGVAIGILVLGFLVLLVTNPSLALSILYVVLRSRGGGGGGGGNGLSGGGGRSGGGGARGSW
jgi:uncharacterized protein